MGRHHNRNGAVRGGYGMAPMTGRLGGFGGVSTLLPLVGVAAVVAILFAMFRRKSVQPALGGCSSCSL